MLSIKRTINELGNFLILWFGQSISLLGSTMTGFALTIWAFEETGSALVLSVSVLFILIPKMIIGVFVGVVIDRLNKKMVMILSDLGAGLCTLVLFLLLRNNMLEIWHIYLINAVNSILGSFQMPASNVTISAIVPKKHYVKANGLQSLSEGIIQMIAPVFAATLLGIAGITGVIITDFITMAFACMSLSFLVRMPVSNKKDNSKFNLHNYFCDIKKGFYFFKMSPLLLKLMLYMVFTNFAAGLAYYGLLSSMILTRTENNTTTLALVNGAIGFGSIVGGLIVLIIPTAQRKIKGMFICLMLSFLFGDILFALGRTSFIWMIAGFLSSIFLPLYMANSDYFWRTTVPIEKQGFAFSFKFALQGGAIPLGSLAGGMLADYVLEPFMKTSPNLLSDILGNTNGSGMALMFLITGVSGVIFSLTGLLSSSMERLESQNTNMKN